MAAPIPCHLNATLRLGEPEEYLALPSRTALLGGHVFLSFLDFTVYGLDFSSIFCLPGT